MKSRTSTETIPGRKSGCFHVRVDELIRVDGCCSPREQPHRRYIFPAKSVYEVNNSGTELPANSIVLALYPNTTCFYQAKVHTVPSKQGNGQYLVQFEEDDNQLREVERKYVLPLPTKQSKLRSSEKK